MKHGIDRFKKFSVVALVDVTGINLYIPELSVASFLTRIIDLLVACLEHSLGRSYISEENFISLLGMRENDIQGNFGVMELLELACMNIQETHCESIKTVSW